MVSSLCKARERQNSRFFGGRGWIYSVALIGLIWLGACGDVTNMKLTYQSPQSVQPDLVFSVRLDQSGSSTDHFVPSLNESSFSSSYSRDDFGKDLVSCSIEQSQVDGDVLPSSSFGGSDCLSLGTYLSNVIFNGVAVSLKDAQLALNSDIQLSGQTKFIFILFVYNASQLGGSPRCFQLKTAQRVGNKFKIKNDSGSFVMVSNLSVSLDEPSIGTTCTRL